LVPNIRRAFEAKWIYGIMGNLTIEDIRKLAELNMTPECYKTYLTVIEPNIKAIIPNYLKDWQNVEGYVTMIVMRHMGIFKTSFSFISIDNDAEERYGDQIDVTKFRKIKKWTFKQKIEYLSKEGILKEHSYKLLDKLREKRNNIHEMGAVFSERELQEFSMAHSVIFYIHLTQQPISQEKQNEMRNLAEKFAENALKVINSN
jgi:hypothetical protein